ncbi:MAG: plasmid recombination protein [Oscillospiraceae bacterium]
MRISFARGRGKIRHNNRDFVSANVDKDRVKNNIVLVQPQSVKEAYKEIFGEAQQKYNEKQKRASRKIDDYYTSIFGDNSGDIVVKNNNKQCNFYEWVVGVGDKDTTGYAAHPELAKVAEKCLQIYFNGSEELGIKSFKERNPQMHVFNAVIHCDESTPHLHFDAVPYAEGYKNGMSRQTAITKSLEQMGYGKGAETIKNFTMSERKIMREIAEAHGLKIEEEQTSDRQRLSCKEYREAAKKMVAEITPQAKKEALEKAMQDVGYMQPTPTKTVKGVFGTKEIPKTAEELQRDRDVALAQTIINERERLLAEAKEAAREVKEKATALSALAQSNATSIIEAARKEAQTIQQKAENEATEIRRKEENALKALKQARSKLLDDIRDSLPPPPIEAAQRAIECAQRARQERIAQIVEEHQQEAEKTKRKITYERD